MRKPYTKGPVTKAEIMQQTKRTVKGCLEWTGSTARNGYGQVRRSGKLFTVTRLLMSLERDFDLTSKQFVLHHCDNPRCVNIKHLYIGDAKDNTRDKVKRDRHNRGERVWKAKLTATDIRKIKRLKKEGYSNASIGRCFGIGRSAIWAIVNDINWKHIKQG